MTFQSEHPDISFTEFLIYAFELTSKWRQFNLRAFCKFFKITQQKIQKNAAGFDESRVLLQYSGSRVKM